MEPPQWHGQPRLRWGWLAVGGTSLPLLAAGAKAVAGGWLPFADQGTIALQALQVFGPHTPLLGQYSFASRLGGKPLFDLGPLIYWLFALPAQLGPTALTVFATFFNLLCLLIALAATRALGGNLPALLLAVALAVGLRSLPAEALVGIWNPSVGLAALLLAAVLACRCAAGAPAALPALFLLAALLAQLHFAFLVPALALLCLALVGLARKGRLWGRPLALGCSLALLLFLPTFYQQATSVEGNLSRAVASAFREVPRGGWRAAGRAVFFAVGFPPAFLRAPTRFARTPSGRQLGPVSGGDYGSTRLWAVLHPPSTAALAGTALLLAWLCLLAVYGWRANQPALGSSAIASLLLLAAYGYVAAATPLRAAETLGYTLWDSSIISIWSYTVAAWGLCAIVGLPTLLRPLLATAALAGGVATALTLAPPSHEVEYRLLGRALPALRATLPRTGAVELQTYGIVSQPFAPALRYLLSWWGLEVGDTKAPHVLCFGPGPLPRRCGATLWEGTLPPAPWLIGATRPFRLAVAVGLRQVGQAPSLTAPAPPPAPAHRSPTAGAAAVSAASQR